jgi:hypothetical protein
MRFIFFNQNKYTHEHANRKSQIANRKSIVYTAFLICFSLAAMTGCKDNSPAEPNANSSHAQLSKSGKESNNNDEVKRISVAELDEKQRKEREQMIKDEPVMKALTEKYKIEIKDMANTQTGLTVEKLKANAQAKGINLNERRLQLPTGEQSILSNVFYETGLSIFAYTFFPLTSYTVSAFTRTNDSRFVPPTTFPSPRYETRVFLRIGALITPQENPPYFYTQFTSNSGEGYAEAACSIGFVGIPVFYEAISNHSFIFPQQGVEELRRAYYPYQP